jgi:hypothetical protein
VLACRRAPHREIHPAAFDPLGLRSAWGWWRLFSVISALAGTTGVGFIGLLIESRLGIPRGVLAVPLVAVTVVMLLCAEGARMLAKLDAYERPRLEVVFIPGEMPFEYVSRTDVGTELQKEQERIYSIGVHNMSGKTVDGVTVRLASFRCKTRAAGRVRGNRVESSWFGASFGPVGRQTARRVASEWLITRKLWARMPKPTHRCMPLSEWYRQRTRPNRRLSTLMRPSTPARNR